MTEQLRERVIRNLVAIPALHRVCSHIYAPFSSRAALPDYVEPNHFPTPSSSPGASSPIIVSARFRSGSTLLWQCFHRLAGFTAYYEPFNDRRWFDPGKRGQRVDSSHRGVSDYSSNYDGLKDLSEVFDDSWGVRHLSLGAKAKHPKMREYIDRLIGAATDRPVLQFNRIDFRLPFLRQQFQDATFVHLNRNPRDTWRSTLRGVKNDPDWSLSSFAPFSKFYLLNWYNDLSMSYPSLWRAPAETHPYELHYLIHRLSELFAIRDCHYFLSYESIENNLDAEMKKLLVYLGESQFDLGPLEGLLAPRQQGYDHSADTGFYQQIEERVEMYLRTWLGGVG